MLKHVLSLKISAQKQYMLLLLTFLQPDHDTWTILASSGRWRTILQYARRKRGWSFVNSVNDTV